MVVSKLKFTRVQFTELANSQWEIIQKFVDNDRKRKHNLRDVINAIFKLTRTGSQWRNMGAEYPSWKVVYYYFSKWKSDGSWNNILSYLVKHERIRNGRHPNPTAVSIDSQSVKKGSFVSIGTGIDGNKRVNGRKRHIIVDMLGLPIAIHVSAANVYDGNEGIELLPQLEKASDRLELIRADHGYQGYFEECANLYNWKVEISQRPPSTKGFVPEKGRWMVERSFAWLNFFRRLSRDYEKTIESSAAFIQIAFIDIILSKI